MPFKALEGKARRDVREKKARDEQEGRALGGRTGMTSARPPVTFRAEKHLRLEPS